MNRIRPIVLALAVFATPLALAHFPDGTPKEFCEMAVDTYVHDYGPSNLALAAGYRDGNVLGDCNGDTIPLDFDGHAEWGPGAARLSSDTGDGATFGSLFCYGEVGHHASPPLIDVTDVVVGAPVSFVVGVDQTGGCGTFLITQSVSCVSSCTPPFGPGTDGVYYVFVVGAQAGHVYSN